VCFMLFLSSEAVNAFICLFEKKHSSKWEDITEDVNKSDCGRSWIMLNSCPKFLKSSEKLLKQRFPNRAFHWSILKMKPGGLPQVQSNIFNALIVYQNNLLP